MTPIGDLLIEYEIEYARRATKFFADELRMPGVPFPLISKDLLAGSEQLARFCIDKILEGKKSLQPNAIGEAIIEFHPCYHEIKDAALRGFTAKFDFLRQVMQDQGHYDTWQQAIKSIFKTRKDYLAATAPHLEAVEAEVAAVNVQPTAREDSIGIRTMNMGLDAYKKANRSIAEELFPDKSVLLQSYHIEYKLYQKNGTDYSLIANGDLGEVLGDKKRIGLLGTNEVKESVFPKLEGLAISPRHGYLGIISDNLVYYHLCNLPTFVKIHGKPNIKINKPGKYVIANPLRIADTIAIILYLGDGNKYSLHIDLKKIKQQTL